MSTDATDSIRPRKRRESPGDFDGYGRRAGNGISDVHAGAPGRSRAPFDRPPPTLSPTERSSRPWSWPDWAVWSSEILIPVRPAHRTDSQDLLQRGPNPGLQSREEVEHNAIEGLGLLDGREMPSLGNDLQA